MPVPTHDRKYIWPDLAYPFYKPAVSAQAGSAHTFEMFEGFPAARKEHQIHMIFGGVDGGAASQMRTGLYPVSLIIQGIYRENF